MSATLISPSRPIVVEPELYSETDYEELCAQGARYELVRGELKTMAPAGGFHGSVTIDLSSLVNAYIIANKLGQGFGAETGFIVEENPRTILAPDFAFIVSARVPVPIPSSFVPIVPDLVLETRNPGDRAGEVADKVELWLHVGACEVWELNPRRQVLTVYRGEEAALTLTANDVLESPLLPGFSLKLERILAAD